MEQMESLSSILGESPFNTGEPAQPDPAPPAEELKTEAPIAEPETKAVARDEAGRFAKTEEAPKTEDKPALTKADVAAIIDERRRRQAAEQELAQLRQQQPKTKTDIFENPDAAISERLKEYLSPLEQTIFGLQLELAKQKMPDFDDAAAAFFQAMQNDPVLKHQVDTAPDQFAFVYREGKRIKELGDVGGDITKYREKVTAEAQAKIAERDEQIKALTAQLEAAKKSQAELAAVPRSLSQVSGAAPKGSDVDPTDINQIVRFK